MPSIKRTISVSFEHRVFFTRGVFARSNSLLQSLLAEAGRAPKALVLLDEGLALAQPRLAASVEEYFAPLAGQIDLVAPPVVIEGGERAKTSYFHVSEIHSQVDRHHIDRHSYIIAIGGGAFLDVAGLAAATAHRGVRLVRLPSTVLAQNDSGVGVKNGINAFGKKNFIGTFAPPFAVINDFDLLATLPAADQRAGFAEAVKVAVVRDAEFFRALEADAAALATFQPEAVERLIERCAEQHVNHIAGGGDPFETGTARPLDFGHWAAHKLEQLSEYRLRHGEAVAIGMALDTLYARHTGLLDAPSCGRIIDLLRRLGFRLFANELLHEDSDHQPVVLKGLEEFREHLGGRLTLTLPAAIGRGVEVHEASLPKMLEAMRELQRLDAAEARRVLPARG